MELDAKLPFAHFAEQRAIGEVAAFGGQVHAKRRSFELDNERHRRTVFSESQSNHYVIIGMNRQLSLTRENATHIGYLESMERLHLHDIRLSQDGLATLRQLPKLEELQIMHVNITDRDIEYLTRQQQLRSVRLGGCNEITNTGVSALTKVKSLRELFVGGCEQTSREIVDLFRKALPECEVKYSKY
jgi:hypothetical protein